MSEFKDLNELITVARQINEGKYDLIDINLAPNSELFSIAQYFSNSIKKLQAVSSEVGKSFETLPAFEAALKGVIQSSKQASEEVLGLVDKINFSIDAAKELLEQIDLAVDKGDLTLAKGLTDRVKDVCTSGSEICFDIISSLEFKGITGQKIEEVLAAVNTLQEQLSHLVVSLGLKQQVIDPETLDKLKDTKEILNDQALVNKLLQEFGL
jgi:chemotaxis protein CheZ